MHSDPFFATEVPTGTEIVRCAEAIAAHAIDDHTRTSRRQVHPTGVRWQNERYLHPLLSGRLGTVVRAAPPTEPGRLDVYVDDQWLCTAIRDGDLTNEDRTIIFQAVWGARSDREGSGS